MADRLEGKVAVITGAASGFGAAMARLFTQEGARVMLGDIQDERGQQIAAALGEQAAFRVCNVAQEAQVAALIDAAVRRYGQLDVMVNNAGIVGAVGPIEEVDGDEWRATLDILLNGVFYGMKHAARVMKPQGAGAMVSLASTAGVLGGLGPHCYTAAKHAVTGLTKSVAAELCHHNIRVNAIAPHSMATSMVASLWGDPDDIETTANNIARTSPLHKAGTADDVAHAALWLCSDDAAYTTGHVLTTDAGVTTGASANGAAFLDKQPMIREAGKRGL
ncbi:MAG: glucose 1-dehydrogenase [Pseudomonadota bacterium]